MVIVKRQKGESVDRLLKRFRDTILREGILPELRERERYKKPSEKRNEKNKRLAYQRRVERSRNY